MMYNKTIIIQGVIVIMPNNQGLEVYQLKLKSKDDTLTFTLIILVNITKTSSNNVINSH